MNQLFKLICWTILFAVVVVAQQPSQPASLVKPPAAASKPPAVPPDVLKRFWQADAMQQRAQRQLEQAQAASQAANQEWQAAVKAMTDACGNNYQLKQDVVGQDPYCGTKTDASAPPAPAEKK
jgi:hypothetical protein